MNNVKAIIATSALAAILYATTPLSNLSFAKDNPRAKASQDDEIEGLASTIAELGVLQPLLVRPTKASAKSDNPNYEVLGGRRRMLALQQLVTDGRIDANSEVPIAILTGKDATYAAAAALADNVQRRAMTDTELWRAVAKLTSKNTTKRDIANTLGVHQRAIPRMTALGSLPAALLKEYDENNVSKDVLVQLTRISDADTRAQTIQSIIDGDVSHWQIREIVSKTRPSPQSPMMRAIGMTNYLDAGGKIDYDLFDVEHAYICDYNLAAKLYKERVDALDAFAKSCGWEGASSRTLEPNYHDDRTHDRLTETGHALPVTDATADDVEAYWAGMRAEIETADFPAELKAFTVLRFEGGYQNTITVHTARSALPEDVDNDEDSNPYATSTKRHEQPSVNPYKGLTGALAMAASKVATRLFVLDVAANPTAALNLFIGNQVAVLVQNAIAKGDIKTETGRYNYTRNLLGVKIEPANVKEFGEFGDVITAEWLQSVYDRCGASTAAILQAIIELQHGAKMAVFAQIVASSIDATVINATTSLPEVYGAAQALGETMELAPQSHWQPDAAFLSKMSKAQLEAALVEMGKPLPEADMKKAARVAYVEECASETGWIPTICKLDQLNTLAQRLNAPIDEAIGDVTSTGDQEVGADTEASPTDAADDDIDSGGEDAIEPEDQPIAA